ncbi:MAG: type VI secretion system protein ImpH [Planctomycetota bacterium]|jgi:type VI secretion system protein ImpH
MASTSRTPDHPLIASLMKRGSEAGFHQLVRILEALPQMSDAVALGHQGPPAREGIRFTPALDLSFGASEVDDIAFDEETGRFTITSRFFGLYGTPSPLPANYTEQLLYDDPDGRLRAFLDIFNHRLLSMRYRAWQKYRHSVQYDGRGTDKMSQRMRILTHLERLGEPIQLLGLSGLLHQQPLSETTFEQILTTVLGVPTEVHSCHVRWIQVPSHQQNQLGGDNCTLGGLCALGGEMRSATTTFQVRIGPLGHRDFKQFLPEGRRRKQLCDLIDRLNGDQLDCKVSIEIDPEAIEPTWLGEQSQGLGWNTWLGEDAPSRAPELGDTVSHSLHSPNNDPMVA